MAIRKTPDLVAVPFVEFLTKVLKQTISRPWRVLLLVSVDGYDPKQFTGPDREIAKVLFGPVEDVSRRVRKLLIWRLGRGSGKTTIAAALGVWIMLTGSLTSVGPGMRAAVVVVAPRTETATLAVQVARALIRETPSIERFVCDAGDTKKGFSIMRPPDTVGGPEREVHFVAVAASRGGVSLRGYDILALILDESEFFTSNTEAASTEGYSISDKDLYGAAKPRLRGPAIFISTPWPVDNLTAEKFEKNWGHPEDALAALGTSTYMTHGTHRYADILEAVEEGLASDPDNAEREYNCKNPSSGGSLVFDRAGVDKAMGLQEGKVIRDRPLVMPVVRPALVGVGGDLGLERDSSVIAVVSNKSGKYVLHEFEEVRPTKEHPLEPRHVIRDIFGKVMERHRVRGIFMDSHYRQSAREHLVAIEKKFLRAPEGSKGKYDTYVLVRNLLREGKLDLPFDKRLRQQMLSVVWKPLPGGNWKISSPRRMGDGGHGDIVSALVLACWGAQKGSKEHPATSPAPHTRPGGDYASMDAGGYDHGGWENNPIDGGGGVHIGAVRKRSAEAAPATVPPHVIAANARILEAQNRNK